MGLTTEDRRLETKYDQIWHRRLARHYCRRFHVSRTSAAWRAGCGLCAAAMKMQRAGSSLATTRVFCPSKLPGSRPRPLPRLEFRCRSPRIPFPRRRFRLAVKSQDAAGGVVVTSSHNPWNWNGVKFKAKFGGSATPAIMKVIEEEVRCRGDAQRAGGFHQGS